MAKRILSPDQLQIIQLLAVGYTMTGATLSKGDMVLEADPADVAALLKSPASIRLDTGAYVLTAEGDRRYAESPFAGGITIGEMTVYWLPQNTLPCQVLLVMRNWAGYLSPRAFGEGVGAAIAATGTQWYPAGPTEKPQPILPHVEPNAVMPAPGMAWAAVVTPQASGDR